MLKEYNKKNRTQNLMYKKTNLLKTEKAFGSEWPTQSVCTNWHCSNSRYNSVDALVILAPIFNQPNQTPSSTSIYFHHYGHRGEARFKNHAWFASQTFQYCFFIVVISELYALLCVYVIFILFLIAIFSIFVSPKSFVNRLTSRVKDSDGRVWWWY